MSILDYIVMLGGVLCIVIGAYINDIEVMIVGLWCGILVCIWRKR